MKFTLLLILLMDILIEINGGSGDKLSGVFFGVPLLFPYDNCELIYNNSNMNYSFYFASQTSPQPTTLTFETISSGKSIQVQHLVSLGQSYISSFEMAPNNAVECSEVCSLEYNCKNNVFGANFLFLGNPTVSVVGFFAGLTFNQSFAMYPVCKDGMKCVFAPRAQYHYHILFGTVYCRDNFTFLDGFTIQMHQKTELTLQLSGEVHVLNNTVEETINKYITSDQDNKYTTLWVEPKVSSCESQVHQISLEGTKIISNKPITVFTNRAKCDTKFSHHTQLVHQMPEVKEWGKTFIIDTQHINILPETVRTNMEFEIAIRSAQNNTMINTTYYQFNQLWYVNTTELTRNEVHRIAMNSMSNSHILITASSSVLIVYTFRSLHVHYSVLVQPVEWFSNKQTIVLQHPTHSEVYRYHISVFIAKEHYNPDDIHIAEDEDLCQGVPLTDYKGFTGNTNDSNGYMVFHMDLIITGGMDSKTQLLLWHRNPEVYLGVTLFAYANDLQYAYSNGYSLGKVSLVENLDSKQKYLASFLRQIKANVCVFGDIESDEINTDGFRCEINVSHPKKSRLTLPLTSGLLTAGLLLISVVCLVSACSCYFRLNGRRTGLVRINQDEEDLRLIEELYKYDALLLFADEDSRFVKYSIYQPLIKEGYRVLWKHDPTCSTFTPGKSVVEGIRYAVEVCRMVVLICTKYFGRELDQEVAYCIDIQNSQGVRKMVPVAIEDECLLTNQLKKYTQIRIKTRNMNYVEHVNFICMLKTNLGKPIDI